MKLGAEPKKVAVLVGLLVVALVVFLMNSTSAPGGSSYNPPTAKSGTGAPARPQGVVPQTEAPVATTRQARPAEREFRPHVRPRRGEARPDPTTIDPTLRLDILAKLQQVNVEGNHRSIFDFGQAPPPEAKPLVAAAKGPKVPTPFGPAPPPPPAAPAAAPEPPKAPPVPLKFYGYISPSNQPNKRAFFMEGEDIHVVREGDVVKSRYKIVRIGVNSVVVEDMQFKSQQTLPLEEQTT
jgi:hypothetical protein